MISDSTYDFEDTILPPRFGLVSGLIAAALMLVLVLALQPLTGFSLKALLAQIGALIWFNTAPETSLVMLGLLLHGLLGSIFGVLYALCQQRAPARGLIAVGLFYGFFLWVGGSLIIGIFLSESLRAMIRSWPWFWACLGFGLCLAASAIWVERQRPAAAMVPKD
ncbi:MAG: hypothetical protein HS126_27060 [Anaerolineales bacterium]|nr:hypothetical protein [Anaerolineales bacterium]